MVTSGDIVNDINAFSGASWADFDNDGDMDLFVTTKWSLNYKNYLYVNNGNGTFTKDDNSVIANDPRMTSWTSGINYTCAWADYDNDLNLDLFVTSVYGGDYLYHNNGDGTFTSIDTDPIVSNAGVNNGGACWGDFDNDGDLDLFVSNFQQNYFYINNGDGTFTKDNQEIIANDITVESYGASWADYDNDGDLDLFVPNAFGAPNNFLYLNIYSNNGNSNHWFKVTLTGVTSNRSAIGARIYIKANINGNDIWQMREINASCAYTGGGECAVSGLVTHFGLGDATIIDSLKVVWPASHITQIFTNVPVNQYVNIIENDDNLTPVKSCTPDLPPENPGYVKGKVYFDNDSNCVYNPTIDEPLPNHLIQAEDGPYYTYSDTSGNYEFLLDGGTYDISNKNLTNEPFNISSCQVDSSYTINLQNGQISSGNDFVLGPAPPCSCDVFLDISPIPSGECQSGIPYSSPCPCNPFTFMFTINNEPSSCPIPASTQVTIHIPQTQITGVNCNNCTTVYSGNTAIVTINTSIIASTSYLITVPVNVDCDPNITSIAPWMEVNIGNSTGGNLITNGDFELGDVGFSTEYIHPCDQYAVTESYYAVTNDLHTTCDMTTWWDCINHTPGGEFFAAYGTFNENPSNKYAWQEIVNGLSTSQTYHFNAFVNNLVKPNFPGFRDPTIEVRINNVPQQSITLPESPDLWLPLQFNWSSGTSTSANIQIFETNSSWAGTDFAIDDISFTEADNCSFIQYYAESFDVNCSCDPNDKMVNPTGCGANGNISKNEPLYYTIYFQNIGGSPAHNIFLRDKIDINLDITSLQVLTTSHSITRMQIVPDNVLEISWDNINLPDSATDEEGSIGYVIFTIRPKSNLLDGTVIKNQAGIYFDRNDVVLTNTTKNTLYDNPEPDANFTYKHACDNTGIVYDFEYAGDTPDNAFYDWFFEDGIPSSSTEQNPSNILFNSEGYKTVTLTINRNGCSQTSLDTILVGSPLSPDGKKVLVCHNGHTIDVSINALPAFLAQGDCVGPCNITTKRMFNNNLVTDTINGGIYFAVYPNPAKDYINVNYSFSDNYKTVELNLINVLGKKIKTIPILNKSGEKTIDMSSFKDGIYFITLSIDGVISAENKVFITK